MVELVDGHGERTSHDYVLSLRCFARAAERAGDTLTTSAVIVTYRPGPTFARCLESLAGEVDEVVVVDNAGDQVEQAGIDRLVTPGDNLGFAGGSNLGAQQATGEVVVFLNPDTIVANGAVRQLAHRLEDPGIGIVMARLRLLNEPDKLNSSGVQVHVTGIGWAGGYGEPADSLTELTEVPAPSGTAMAMRAETFRELGGFAEELFMYLEDLELGWRARLAGYRVVLEPSADVFHEYEYGRNPRKSYYLERNRLVFVLSAYSARRLLLLTPVLVLTELGMAALAFKEGWFRDKVAGWSWLLRNARVVMRRRQQTQALRRRSDRDLSRYLTATFSPGMTPVPALLRVANPFVRGYWRLVRLAL
jgi:GT2 family glycosyltransferase